MTSRRSPKVCSRSSVLVALALVAFGCTERELDLPEHDETFDLAGRDLAGGPRDFAGVDQLSCTGSEYVTVSLSSLVTLDGLSTFSPTAAVRVIVGFPASPDCALPADITTTVTPGNATTAIAITAHLWVGQLSCPVQTVYREVTVGSAQASNARVVISDASPTAIVAPLSLTAVGSFTPTCAMQGGPGVPCENDCDCATGDDPALLCLSEPSGERRCARPCHDDAECRNGAGSLCDRGDSWQCRPSQMCRAPSDCAFGETVQSCICTPALRVGGGTCSCDKDCPTGTLCISGACQQPCTGPHTCGVYGDGEGGIECLQGLCVQLI